MPDEKKPFERRMVSDFTMGLLDFERYDRILQGINEAFEKIHAGEPMAIYSLYANLNSLYLEWSPVMLPSVKKGIKEDLESLSREIDNMTFTDKENDNIKMMKEESFKESMRLIFIVREKLMEERQKAGFGIKTSIHATEREIAKRSLQL
jgi:hypothetical protein